MLLLGGMGTGKTAQAVSLLQELPEVRLIIVPEGETAHIPALIAEAFGLSRLNSYCCWTI